MKIIKYIKIICNYLLRDSELSKKFIIHNSKIWKNYKQKNNEGILLMDYITSYENEIPRSYFANIFSKKYKADFYIFSDQKSILLNKEWRNIYKSFNVNRFIYIFYTKFFFKLFFSFKKKSFINENINTIFSQLALKTDLLKIKYKNIEIGREIYAEYLMRYRKSTVDIRDKKLKNLIREAVLIVEYWIDFFENNNVLGVSLSHPNTRFLAIIGKIANLSSIPVFSITNTYLNKNMNLNNHFEYIRNNYLINKNLFSQLNAQTKKNAIEWSKKRLNLRLSGSVGVDMHYTNETAFHKSYSKRILKKTEKKKALICTHEFYDDPNYTGGLLFADFWEWLIFIGEKSKNSNCEWYLKNHPDADKWTKEVINEFLQKFKHISLIDERSSFLQLKEEGLSYVFTAHGTVGHECPLLGIQVINADLNHPHMAYNFNWSPKNLNELSEIILNLDKLHLKINLDEVYEYYYTVKKMNIEDDLIFNSYNDAKEIERDKNKNLLNIFLEQFNEKKHFQIIEKMTKNI